MFLTLKFYNKANQWNVVIFVRGGLRPSRTYLSIFILNQNVQPCNLIFIFNRLLVQMEETEKVFDDFWEQFSGRLKQCHSLRAFEENFNIVQVCNNNFNWYYLYLWKLSINRLFVFVPV